MAKTIKFNLRFGDKMIRTVDDLREHFSMDDVLAHFENGLLKKFLQRRGYTAYAEKIEELSGKNFAVEAKARELIKIFEITADDDAIDEYAEVVRLHEEKRKAYEAYAQGKLNEQEVIMKYFGNYNKVVENIIENKNDLGKIKAGTKELLDTYKHILEIDWRALFYRLTSGEALYPVCHMLTNKFFRYLWLTEDASSAESGDTKYVNSNLVKTLNYEIQRAEDSEEGHPWIRKSNKADAAYWEDIVTAGKTYMILQVPRAAKVRAPGDIVNELESSLLNEKFITLDGIQYRHNSTREYLFYAEV